VARKKSSKKSNSDAVRSAAGESLFRIPARDPESGLLHVIVDTPAGSPIKFKYDIENRCYKASYLFAPGTVFPFDFGSVPSTLAEDGDPLDALVLMEKPSFTGCLVPVRLLGVLEAEQTQEGKTFRNDRLIGAAEVSREYEGLSTLKDVPTRLLKDLESFFVFYNATRGRIFKVLGRFGPDRARRLVSAGERRFRRAVRRRRSQGTRPGRDRG
jgi:inorganic pyrophosphatase